MLLDDGDGPANVNDAGFDFDAIVCVHPAKPDTVGHLTGHVYDAFTLGPVVGAAVISGDSTTITDSAGKYSMELIRGKDELCAVMDGYRSECDTLVILPGQADSHDFYLFPTLGINEKNDANSDVKIIPNPFTTDFDLLFSLHEPGRCKIELFDLSGRKVSTIEDQQFAAGFHRISGASKLNNFKILTPGSYILVIHTLNSVIQRKVIKAL